MPILNIANLSTSELVEVLPHGAVKIRNPAFKYSYSVCSIGGISNDDFYVTEYLKERWEFFNKHLYGGVMKCPPFKINRKKRILGLWRPYSHLMEFGKQMFDLGGMTGEKDLLGTLVHEMAHQYVSEILHSPEKDAHGPVWQHVMQSVGMTTDAKYTGPRLKTKKQIEREEEVRQRLQNNQRLVDKQVESPTTLKIEKYTVFRYLNPDKAKDMPVIVEPGIPGMYASGWEVKKDGKVNLDVRCTFQTRYLVIPGPLKIRTPLYRAAQAKADELNQNL
jgi:hypothetical protein